jgi:hypothetical protein
MREDFDCRFMGNAVNAYDKSARRRRQGLWLSENQEVAGRVRGA